MAFTDVVTNLRRQGVPESEIETRLKNQGISPMEINDAMNQAKIKEAVAGESEDETKGMTPSIMGDEEEEAQREDNPYPPSSQAYTPSPAPALSQNYENYSYQENRDGNYPSYSEPQGNEEYYEDPSQNQGYNNYNPQEGYGMNSSETMIEVAEQVFSEKIKKIEEDIKALNEFKAVYSPRIDDMKESLRRIETNFDKMQIAILERVGTFGKSIDSVKKEVEMVEDSFEKLNRKK